MTLYAAINLRQNWFRYRLVIDSVQNHYLNQYETTVNQNLNVFTENKANLRDLIAATGLVILLKLD